MSLVIGSNEVAARSPRAIKRDFVALGRLVKESEAQAELSRVLSVRGNAEGRNGKSQLISTWL